jgi:hypothetical protein
MPYPINEFKVILIKHHELLTITLWIRVDTGARLWKCLTSCSLRLSHFGMKLYNRTLGLGQYLLPLSKVINTSQLVASRHETCFMRSIWKNYIARNCVCSALFVCKSKYWNLVYFWLKEVFRWAPCIIITQITLKMFQIFHLPMSKM